MVLILDAADMKENDVTAVGFADAIPRVFDLPNVMVGIVEVFAVVVGADVAVVVAAAGAVVVVSCFFGETGDAFAGEDLLGE